MEGAFFNQVDYFRIARYPGVSAIDSRKPTYRPIGTTSEVPVKV
jgi:hypothetical protein